MHHDLKILPQYFQPVLDGRKTFEVRLDDRGFQAGDTVALHEYDTKRTNDALRYTGRVLNATIGYVTAYEQRQGYVVFSLMNVLKRKAR